MQYELKGGNFPVVVCQLENQEKMITEKGSMVWMTANMEMETSGGGLGKMFSKAISGESMFRHDRLRIQLPWEDHAPGDCPGQRVHSAKDGVPGLGGRGAAVYPL